MLAWPYSAARSNGVSNTLLGARQRRACQRAGSRLTHAPSARCSVPDGLIAAYAIDGVTDVLRAVDMVVAGDVLTPHFTVTAGHDVA